MRTPATPHQSLLNTFFEPEEAPAAPSCQYGVTDAGLAYFQSAHPGEHITKEDLFYYVYGILHSSDHRERYAHNLGKELPRIPRLKTANDFWTFSRAGHALGDLHVDYEGGQFCVKRLKEELDGNGGKRSPTSPIR
jgi:predicted helicase